MLKQTKHIADTFTLDSGDVLKDVEIAYQTFGALDASRSNAVLVLHALTGWTDPTEWWSGLVGEGKTIDPAEHYIICPNFLGSCYGSTGPESIDPETARAYGASFPEITIRDIARANWELLDTLAIDRLALGIGGSMGGMVLLEMAQMRPAAFRAIVPIAVSASHSAWRIAFSSVIRKTIVALDPSLRDRCALERGLAIARQFATISYRCSLEFDARFARAERDGTFEVEHYLEHQGEKIVERFSVFSYVVLTRAMELYSLGEVGLSDGSLGWDGSASCECLLVGISSDLLYPAAEIRAFAESFGAAEYLTLEASHGHDSFLVDAEQLGELVAPFLERVGLIAREVCV